MDIFGIISNILLILWTLIDKFGWLIFVWLAYYLWCKYWANDSAKSLDSLVKVYSERIRPDSLASRDIKNNKENELTIKKVGESYDNYVRLLEKYRHNIAQQWRLRQDWRIYLQAHKDIEESWRDYGFDLNENLLRKAGDREYKAKIRIDEIEKRFKKLENEK